MFPRLWPAFLFLSLLGAQTPPDPFISAIMKNADEFRRNAGRLISEETLLQRSYALPPHRHLAIGAAAGPLFAFFQVNEVISAYSVGSLKGDTSGVLLELREIVSKNGVEIQTPEKARKALSMDASSGDERIRKKLLAEFTDLGLVDVATDYGLILMAFTKAGMDDLKIERGGSAWIGTEPAIAFQWSQIRGGALEFRGRKVARRPMQGEIWVREADGFPLRVIASIEHEDGSHRLRDDGAVDFVASAFGFPTPATVVHRHSVDGSLLTENLYTYGKFRLFQTDSEIEYTGPVRTDKE